MLRKVESGTLVLGLRAGSVGGARAVLRDGDVIDTRDAAPSAEVGSFRASVFVDS